MAPIFDVACFHPKGPLQVDVSIQWWDFQIQIAQTTFHFKTFTNSHLKLSSCSTNTLASSLKLIPFCIVLISLSLANSMLFTLSLYVSQSFSNRWDSAFDFSNSACKSVMADWAWRRSNSALCWAAVELSRFFLRSVILKRYVHMQNALVLVRNRAKYILFWNLFLGALFLGIISHSLK